MKNFSGQVGNRIRDFAASSAVLQPTALPPTPILRKSTAFERFPTFAQLKLKKKTERSRNSNPLQALMTWRGTNLRRVVW